MKKADSYTAIYVLIIKPRIAAIKIIIGSLTTPSPKAVYYRKIDV
jgi:hypothetical protein